MLDRCSATAVDKTRVVVLSTDANFTQSVRSILGAKVKIELSVIDPELLADQAKLQIDDGAIVIIDLNATRHEDLSALQCLMTEIRHRAPVIVVTQASSEMVPCELLQMRITDVLVKPVTPIELVRACSRATQSATHNEMKEAQICTFLPATGGVGATTLAIQSALTLHGSKSRGNQSTCLIDLDFHHGACADYLDIEPRLDLKEIEPNPKRLDRQLLECMLSHHSSGLTVIAAPNAPIEMRPFDPNAVMSLLNLVCECFDYIVIDLPRTWNSWTDKILLGSNKLFLVSEMTVPGLRRTKRLIAEISKRLGQAPHPKVVVNRFERRLFSPGLRRADIIKVLGDAFAGTVPYNYRLVREAIDRGVSLEEVKRNNNIAVEIRKLILPSAPAVSKSSLRLPVFKTLPEKSGLSQDELAGALAKILPA